MKFIPLNVPIFYHQNTLSCKKLTHNIALYTDLKLHNSYLNHFRYDEYFSKWEEIIHEYVARQLTLWNRVLLVVTLISYSAYSSSLKMMMKFSSETPVDFQRTTLRYTPEDSALQSPS
jgi:hypothetical protein